MLRLRLGVAVGLGVAMAGLFWGAFTAPFPLAEFCDRRPRDWVLPLFGRVAYSGLSGWVFLGVFAASGLGYLLALRAARGLRGRLAALLLVGVVPLGLLLVLLPGHPLLSGDIFKYVFGGRIWAVYGQNPFLHVPAEFALDPFYELVRWRTHVNAHGPLWRLAESSSAALGGERCGDVILLMKLWPGLAYLGTTAALFGTLRVWQPERAVSGTMVYAWNPLVVLEAIQNGHNDVVAALPAVAAVWAMLRGRPGWAFPLLAVAVLIKPLAVVLGPLLLLAALRGSSGRRRELVAGIAVAAALVVLAYLPFWEGPATLQGLDRARLFSASPAKAVQLGLRAAGLSLGRSQLVAGAVANGVFLLLLAALLLAAWRGRVPLVAAATGSFLLYLFVGAQWFNPWYLLWVMPLAALAPEGPPRILAVAFTLLAPLAYPLQNEDLPVVLVVFAPMLLLAWRYRGWLGWPGWEVGVVVPSGAPPGARQHFAEVGDDPGGPDHSSSSSGDRVGASVRDW
jgi:alpha-1,6-mannosyltransferase